MGMGKILGTGTNWAGKNPDKMGKYERDAIQDISQTDLDDISDEELFQQLDEMSPKNMSDFIYKYQSMLFGELWVPCPKSMDLRSLLQSRRLENLYAMAAMNDLMLHSMKKKDVAATLAACLPEITDSFVHWTAGTLIRIWDAVIAAGGLYEITSEDDMEAELEMQIAMTSGLLFPVQKGKKRYLAAPAEHKTRYPAEKRQELLQACIKADQMRKTLQSILAIQGTLPLDELLEHVSDLMDQPVTPMMYLNLMSTGKLRAVLNDRDEIFESEGWLYVDSGYLEDREETISWQERVPLAYKRYDMDTLDVLTEGECLANLPGQNELQSLLGDYLDELEAEALVDSFIDNVQLGEEPNEEWAYVVDLLLEAPVSIRQNANRLMALLHDHTPQYRFKGHSAIEIATLKIQVPFRLLGGQNQQKPGRNDVCLCGSGKKYKHCCGR